MKTNSGGAADDLAVPGDVEEDKTLELHLLDLGRQVCAVTLGVKRRTERGVKVRGQRSEAGQTQKGTGAD